MVHRLKERREQQNCKMIHTVIKARNEIIVFTLERVLCSDWSTLSDQSDQRNYARRVSAKPHLRCENDENLRLRMSTDSEILDDSVLSELWNGYFVPARRICTTS